MPKAAMAAIKSTLLMIEDARGAGLRHLQNDERITRR